MERLIKACGGGYSPETRRKYYISGPQWAAAYEGHALFHAPTREPVGFEKVIEEYGRKIGIGHWATHDTDVIPTPGLFKDEQEQIVARIKASLSANGLKCSMVTTETFHHAVWAASPAAEAPEVRAYAARRLANTVKIGHQLGAEFAVYWPGLAGIFRPGRGGGDSDAAMVRGGPKCRLRGGYSHREGVRSADIEALHGSEAV